MKYQFRPNTKIQPTEVTLTGKVYEKGEHPIYTEHRIIEVVDKEGQMHYAFEDELKSDEVKQQERSYSEEEVLEVFEHFKMDLPFHYEFLVKEHLQQLKKK